MMAGLAEWKHPGGLGTSVCHYYEEAETKQKPFFAPCIEFDIKS